MNKKLQKGLVVAMATAMGTGMVVSTVTVIAAAVTTKCWVKTGQTWNYLKDGRKQTAWINDRGTWYFLNASGVMQTGWIKDGTAWYLLNSNGAMKTGWVNDGGTWYLLNASGAMRTGWVKDGVTWFFLNASGAMKTGWVKDGATKYFLNSGGAMKTGWIKDGATWYFLNSSGAMAFNAIVEGWKLDASGAGTEIVQADLNSGTTLAAKDYTITSDSGVFGPTTGNTIVNGNVTVIDQAGSSLTLKNLNITGTLSINYGAGSVVLENVIVNGVNVSNVGSNSLHIKGNTAIKTLNVNDANSDAHIVVEDNATVTTLVVNSGANIEVAETATNANPFENVILSPKSNTSVITLKGNFQNVNVTTIAIIEIKSGTVKVSSDNNILGNIVADSGSIVSVPTGWTITKSIDEPVVSEGTVLVKNVTEFNNALKGDAKVIRMAAGTYAFDSQIRIAKAINIIGAGDLTVITKGDAAWSNITGSKGYASLITINNDENVVNLENIKVSGAKNISMTTGGTDYASGINVVSSPKVTLKNITSTNNAAAGLIVNSSIVTAENLNTSFNVWYGVNVDKSDSGASSFTLTGNGAINEVTQIFSDKTVGVTVSAAGYNTYKVGSTTKTLWTNKELQNVATITKDGAATLYLTIQAAIDASTAGDTINVAAGTYELSKQLKITKPITIKGIGNVTIKATDAAWVINQSSDKNLIGINGVIGLVKLENLTIASSKRNGINAWESNNVLLEKITSKNNSGAGLVINNSIVVANNLNTEGNSWGYGVNVDNGSSPSVGAPKTSFTLNSGIISEAKQIVSDKGGVTIVAPNYLVYINGIKQ